MPRQLRLQYEGAIYHLLSRGDRREAIFHDQADRTSFLDTLAAACAKTAWQVHAYCLMFVRTSGSVLTIDTRSPNCSPPLMPRQLRLQYEESTSSTSRGTSGSVLTIDTRSPNCSPLLMPRQLRLQYEGAIYHLLSRGDRREAIFHDQSDRTSFLDTLAAACAKTAWQVHAYCLMSNHFHLVIETPRPNLTGLRGQSSLLTLAPQIAPLS